MTPELIGVAATLVTLFGSGGAWLWNQIRKTGREQKDLAVWRAQVSTSIASIEKLLSEHSAEFKAISKEINIEGWKATTDKDIEQLKERLAKCETVGDRISEVSERVTKLEPRS